MLKFIRQLFARQKKQWQDIEYFNPEWKERIKTMASLVPVSAKSIADLGCGMMWLKEFIDPKLNYIPVDYISRDENTIVCDFNKHEYPQEKTDVTFVSGCLEYVKDHNWFVEQIFNHSNQCILSYCVLEEFSDLEFRKGKTWVNAMTEKEIIKLFTSHGFLLDKMLPTKNRIFYFTKK